MEKKKNGKFHNYVAEYTQEGIGNIIHDLKSGIAHGILVSNLAYALAKEMQLEEQVCYNISLAGFLHDIGKLELSPYLYGRNMESFSIEEMKYMRMHSKLSYDVLINYEYPDSIIEDVLCHHECFDGSGYPNNLVGEQIPLGSRIISVVDVFAALISDRPYRKAFDLDTAVDIMIEEVKNLDMRVFITFQRLIHEPHILELIDNCKINLDTELDLEELV